MADNWSPSVLTLTNRGDWAKWDFTIPDSATADDFNGDPDFTRRFLASRIALTTADRKAVLKFIVNDILAIHMVGSDSRVVSTFGWISADRFNFQLDSPSGFETVDPTGFESVAGVDMAPWVVGTNTIRLLSLGSDSYLGATFGDPEPIEIDFVVLDTGSLAGYGRFGVASPGDDTHVETAPAAFVGHINGDPFDPTDDDHGWFLKAPDATTGTASMPVFEVEKMCPSGGGNVTAKLRITEDGSAPVAGIIGVEELDIFTSQIATLDGEGRAEFTFPDDTDVAFWYGGNDDWMPLTVNVLAGFRKGCQGWHLGRVGVGR